MNAISNNLYLFQLMLCHYLWSMLKKKLVSYSQSTHHHLLVPSFKSLFKWSLQGKLGKIKLGKDETALQKKKCPSRKPPQNLQMSFVYLQGASSAELFCRTACRHSLYPGTASQYPSPWWAGLWNHSDQTSGTQQQQQPLALGGFSHSSTGYHSSGKGSGDFVHENPAWSGACVFPSGWPYFHQDSAGISEDDSANTEREARTGWRRCKVLNAAACIKLLHLIVKHKPHYFNPHFFMMLPHVFSVYLCKSLTSTLHTYI